MPFVGPGFPLIAQRGSLFPQHQSNTSPALTVGSIVSNNRTFYFGSYQVDGRLTHSLVLSSAPVTKSGWLVTNFDAFTCIIKICYLFKQEAPLPRRARRVRRAKFVYIMTFVGRQSTDQQLINQILRKWPRKLRNSAK